MTIARVSREFGDVVLAHNENVGSESKDLLVRANVVSGTLTKHEQQEMGIEVPVENARSFSLAVTFRGQVIALVEADTVRNQIITACMTSNSFTKFSCNAYPLTDEGADTALNRFRRQMDKTIPALRKTR